MLPSDAKNTLQLILAKPRSSWCEAGKGAESVADMGKVMNRQKAVT